MSDGPYLFDVGVTALAHAGTPVSEPALSYVRQAITGDLEAIIPYTSVIGAQHVLSNVYGFSNTDSSRILQRFTEARRIHWYDDIGEQTVQKGLEIAANVNIEGWDGYYAHAARSEGAEKILTIDRDFERVDGIDVEIILTQSEFRSLNDYLTN